MAIDYEKTLSEITIKGYFSEYLPPCFRFDERLLNYDIPEKYDLIEPLTFSMSRFSTENSRRHISIPDIVSYLAVFKHIKDNDILKEIIEFTSKNNISFSPILSNQGEILTHEKAYCKQPAVIGKASQNDDEDISLYINNIMKKISMSLGAKKILKLDISNCYSSFYTHMIPSIILGYDKAYSNFLKYNKNKEDHEIDPKYKIYNSLDKRIRGQNLNRTNGLLTGPLFSRIIMEGILCRIDIEIKERCPKIKYARYVDDYEIYLFDGHRIDDILSLFYTTFKKYGFSFNSQKTEIVDFPFYLASNLNNVFAQFTSSPMDAERTMQLFNEFLTWEKKGTKGAIRFLLKNLEVNKIDMRGITLYKSYLLSILSNDLRSLINVCTLLCNEDIYFSESETRLIKELLFYNLKCGCELETIWLLYILIKHNKIDYEIIRFILESNNELAKLIIYKNLPLSSTEIDLMINSESWLLLYEMYLDNKISETIFKQKLQLDKSYDFYSNLKNNAVSFCKKVDQIKHSSTVIRGENPFLRAVEASKTKSQVSRAVHNILKDKEDT